jgi:formylglycine-generating enzyme
MKAILYSIWAAGVVTACSSDPPSLSSSGTGTSSGGTSDAGIDPTLAKPCPSGKGPRMVRVPAGDTTQCIDTTEVTRTQYAAFLADVASGTVAPRDSFCQNATFDTGSSCMNEQVTCKRDCDQHPQVCVSWCAAFSYCKWAGKKLCGNLDGSAINGANPDLRKDAWMNICGSGVTSTGNPRLGYPYGNDYQAGACNTGNECNEQNVCSTVPVASFTNCHGQGPYAEIFDMAGNVGEWVDERGNGSAMSVGARGSSFDEDPLLSGCNGIKTSASDPANTSPFIGIRCCAD